MSTVITWKDVTVHEVHSCLPCTVDTRDTVNVRLIERRRMALEDSDDGESESLLEEALEFPRKHWLTHIDTQEMGQTIGRAK